jgi:hypothetical protein
MPKPFQEFFLKANARIFSGPLPERQYQKLAWTALYVPG